MCRGDLLHPLQRLDTALRLLRLGGLGAETFYIGLWVVCAGKSILMFYN